MAEGPSPEPNWVELLGNEERPADDELAPLFDEIEAEAADAPLVPAVAENPAPAPSTAATDPGGPTWERALHLLPAWARQLVARYPAIGIAMREGHGRVLLAAYLEDSRRGVRRNLKIGNDIFHYAEELEKLEPDAKHLGCRIVIKTLPYRVGTTVRYWENTPRGDTDGKRGSFLLTEQGLRRLGPGKGSR